MKHPECVYSHDLENNCTYIVWGESGYYTTNLPKGKYTDDVIDWMNDRRSISPKQRKAMELCSIAAQNDPNLDWEKHYEKIMKTLSKGSN